MGKLILIVEDEIIIARELEDILHNLGHQVCGFAATAVDAIQKAQECRPDLVLMDIQLRGEDDGIQAAEKIKKLYNIPLIYVTAYADQQILDRAKITEPFGYILKPVEPRNLEVAIAIALYKHQAEKERAELQARLHQAQKMEAISTLAAGIAHNFNNILGAVMFATSMTFDNLPEDSNERENLQIALQGCEKAKNIVSQFLTFSRQAEPNRPTVQLDSIIIETLTSLQESLPSNIVIDRHIEATPGLIAANPIRLKEMLGHLYSNAIYAMQEKGGILEVKLEDLLLNEEQQTAGQSLPPGLYWRLTISDTGHGIDQAIMDRIFDPFFTTKGVGTGLGLGLSVVYGIVRCHEGSIIVSSEPEKGTKFTILLPKVDN
jgi:signal transduction histidine kinase